jgi:hypothetical protein
LVYTIAAYSITIGTLALYGVMIRYRQRVAVAALAEVGGALARDPRQGFNLGAALLAPFWLWVHGMRLPGVILLIVGLSIGPLYRFELALPLLLVAVALGAAGAALGFAGNRIAYGSREPEDPAAFAASQLPWALTGIVLHVFVLPWAFFFWGS